MTPRVLIVENEALAAAGLTLSFEQDGFSTKVALDGGEALDVVSACNPDLILLELRLPVLDGFEVLRRMRQASSRPPVIVASAITEVESRIEVFELGAADYLPKPYSVRELKARVNARLRTWKDDAAERPITLFPETWEIEASGRRMRLTPTEFRLLQALVRNAGVVQTRRRLLETVWKVRVPPITKPVDVHVSGLRAKLRQCGLSECVATVRKQGFVWHDSPDRNRMLVTSFDSGTHDGS